MDARLARLLEEYVAGTAAQAPVHRLPVLSDDDLRPLVRHLHDEMDAGVRARNDYARQHGHRIACADGCNHCCATVIVVYDPEAVRVAAWLAEPAHAEARAEFEAALPAWRAGLGDGPAELARLHQSGQIAEAEAKYDELQQRHVMCAFNRAGSCTIYPVRPNVCRNAHALDSDARCRPESTQRPRSLEFPRVDAYIDQATSVMRTMHRRRRGPEPPGALCDVVARKLTEAAAAPPSAAPAPSRNRPCPCGSGKKYKHCCG